MTAIHDRHVTTLRRQVRISLVGSELLDGVAFDSNATFSLRCLVSQQRLTQPAKIHKCASHATAVQSLVTVPVCERQSW